LNLILDKFLNISTTYKGIAFASFTALLWGFLAIVLKIATYDIAPVDIAWMRFFIAFLGLGLYYIFRKPVYFAIFKKPPVTLLIAAISLSINYFGFITGIHLTTPSVAQVFIQLGPVLLAISGFTFFKERVYKKQIAGLIIAVAGLLLFYNEQLSVLIGDPKIFKNGVLWVVIGALAWAFYATFQKRLVFDYHPMQLNLVLFGVPVILLAPFVTFTNFSALSINNWLILLFLGGNTLGAYCSLAYALKFLEANKVSVIIIQNPIITFVIMAVLGEMQVNWIQPEKFTLLTLTGAFLVIIGAGLTVFSKKR